jgi:hypothetical protein
MHPSAVFSRLHAKDITKQTLNAADGDQPSHHVERPQTKVAKHGVISINDDPTIQRSFQVIRLVNNGLNRDPASILMD